MRKQFLLHSLVQTICNFKYRQFWVFQKPLTLLKLILRATDMRQMADAFDDFQKLLFRTLHSRTNLAAN